MNHTSANAVQLEFLFGGTFDPFHLGHLAIIERLQLLADDMPVRLLPCAIPPLKSKPSTLFNQRVEMLKAAIQGISNIVIDPRESERSQPSYTVDTLIQLKQEYPRVGIVLVMGMDSLADIMQWHQWQKLAELCHLLVVNRPGSEINELKTHMINACFQPVDTLESLKKAANGLAMCVKMPEKPHSSTQIRSDIKNQQPLDSLLPQSVIEYIRQHQLYQSEIN